MLSRIILAGLAGLLSTTMTVRAHDHGERGPNNIGITTTVTIYTCTSGAAICQERSAVADTTYLVSATSAVQATVTGSHQAISTLSTVLVVPQPATYPAVGTSVIGSVSAASTAGISDVRSISSASPSGVAPSYSTGGSLPVISNSTLTAPTLPDSFTSILVATGSPTLGSLGTSTVTSVQVVRASSTSPGATASPLLPANTGGRLAVNSGTVLGFVALGAYLLGQST